MDIKNILVTLVTLVTALKSLKKFCHQYVSGTGDTGDKVERHMNKQEITPERFDRALVSKPEKLWGAPAIAAALGVSVDTVYRWAKDANVPVCRVGGRYFAFRAELDAWMRNRIAA